MWYSENRILSKDTNHTMVIRVYVIPFLYNDMNQWICFLLKWNILEFMKLCESSNTFCVLRYRMSGTFHSSYGLDGEGFMVIFKNLILLIQFSEPQHSFETIFLKKYSAATVGGKFANFCTLWPLFFPWALYTMPVTQAKRNRSEVYCSCPL